MEEKKSSDFLWKIVLCGDSFVGKTTIRKRAMGEHFAEEYISTVGADFSSYKLKLSDLTIGFQVWDLAGQDKYKYIRSSFYGGATGCFLVFDVTNPKSLRDLSAWVDEAIRYSNGTIEIFIICANKIDLIDRREITSEMGQKYALALRESSGLQCEYIETSALTGENIDVAFDLMAKCLLEREGISPFKPKEEIVEASEEQVVIEQQHQEVSAEVKTTSKIVDTIPSSTASIMLEDESGEETEKLIAEVMAVLDETDEIIIGREKTDDGERAITISKESIEEQDVEEEVPEISTELENVLEQINVKLDSLTNRLKGLEEEISHVKANGLKSEVDEQIEDISDVRDELEVLKQETSIEEADEKTDVLDEILEDANESEDVDINSAMPEPMIPIVESTEEGQLDQDQKVLESILDTVSPQPDTTESEEVIIEEPEEIADEEDQIIDLLEIPDNELVDIPDAEPLIPIEEDDDEAESLDDGVIGTELSSAMISELKDMSQEEKPEEEKIIQTLYVDSSENKNTCPICGEDVKYIRQYKKFYCIKCGRYLI